MWRGLRTLQREKVSAEISMPIVPQGRRLAQHSPNTIPYGAQTGSDLPSQAKDRVLRINKMVVVDANTFLG